MPAEEVEVKSLSRVRLLVTPQTVARQAPLSWDFRGKNTGVGCHFLLQEIVPTQGLNPGLPHCRQMLLPSEPPGKSADSHINNVIPLTLTVFVRSSGEDDREGWECGVGGRPTRETTYVHV